MAMQQIITLGVPGTAMPAWGDRMTEADIQAIVGFMRQWETTAPEVAQPLGPPSGGGGPPWLRNQTTTTTNSAGTVATQVPGAVATANPAAQSAGAGGQTGSQMSEQDMATHMAQEAANGGGQGRGQGAGTQEQAQAAEPDALDWRVLALFAGSLSVAFTLIAIGVASLKRARNNRPSP